MPITDEYETTKEAAERLGVNESRVRQLLAEGRLIGERLGAGFGGVWMVKKDSWPETKGFGRPLKWAGKAERAARS